MKYVDGYSFHITEYIEYKLIKVIPFIVRLSLLYTFLVKLLLNIRDVVSYRRLPVVTCCIQCSLISVHVLVAVTFLSSLV